MLNKLTNFFWSYWNNYAQKKVDLSLGITVPMNRNPISLRKFSVDQKDGCYTIILHFKRGALSLLADSRTENNSCNSFKEMNPFSSFISLSTYIKQPVNFSTFSVFTHGAAKEPEKLEKDVLNIKLRHSKTSLSITLQNLHKMFTHTCSRQKDYFKSQINRN